MSPDTLLHDLHSHNIRISVRVLDGSIRLGLTPPNDESESWLRSHRTQIESLKPELLQLLPVEPPTGDLKPWLKAMFDAMGDDEPETTPRFRTWLDWLCVYCHELDEAGERVAA